MTQTKRTVTPRAAQAAETRRRLIDSAILLFSEKTYEEVAVADIAKAAGVAHGLLFHYFGAKRGIYLEAMHEAARQLDAAFVVDPTLTPDLQVRQALKQHLRYLSTHRGLALRLVLGGRGTDPEAWEVFEGARARALGVIMSMVGLDADTPALQIAGRAAVGAVDVAAAFWLQNDLPFDIDAVVESMVVILGTTFLAAESLDPSLDIIDAARALVGPAFQGVSMPGELAPEVQ